MKANPPLWEQLLTKRWEIGCVSRTELGFLNLDLLLFISFLRLGLRLNTTDGGTHKALSFQFCLISQLRLTRHLLFCGSMRLCNHFKPPSWKCVISCGQHRVCQCYHIRHLNNYHVLIVFEGLSLKDVPLPMSRSCHWLAWSTSNLSCSKVPGSPIWTIFTPECGAGFTYFGLIFAAFS